MCMIYIHKINNAQIKTNSQHHRQHISQQPKTQHNYKHHTTQRTPFPNNTPQSNASYHSPTQDKQMSHPTFIFKQNRQTPIITMPPLHNRTTYNNTLIQVQQNKHTCQGHGFVDAPVKVRSLQAKWEWDRSDNGPGCQLKGGYNQPACLETDVGQQQQVCYTCKTRKLDVSRTNYSTHSDSDLLFRENDSE